RDRAGIGARRDVAMPEVDAGAERLEHAAPDEVRERVVAEEPEVPRAAAGRDPRRDRRQAAEGALPRETVEIRRARGLERRHAEMRGMRQVAEPVEHEQ